MPDNWTPIKLIRWTAEYLEKAGVPNPRLDAELLLAHLLKWKRIDLYTQHEKKIGEKDLTKFKELIQRRAKREPLQHILGEAEFYGLKFKVTPEVFIPRPETELLVEEAIKILRGNFSPDASTEPAVGSPLAGSPPPALSSRPSFMAAEGRDSESFRRPSSEKHPLRILEIGTGSGCIAIALAKHLPQAQTVATDISKAALEIARTNAQHHEVEQRVQFIPADIAPWRVFQAEGRLFDLIVSNPPYIPSDDFPNLQPEVRDFEPRKALDGGPRGLEIIQKIVQQAPHFLKPGGLLLLEIGEGQAGDVQELAQKNSFSEIQIRKDLQGIERILIAQK